MLVPLHIGMWHPFIIVCWHCERREEVTTRCGCPCSGCGGGGLWAKRRHHGDSTEGNGCASSVGCHAAPRA